jgi:hypothetical protein
MKVAFYKSDFGITDTRSHDKNAREAKKQHDHKAEHALGMSEHNMTYPKAHKLHNSTPWW